MPNPIAIVRACAVVVQSCDKYQDTWTPFFQLFNKFWADCSFPVYHVTNCLDFKLKGVQSITVGPELPNQGSWSDTVLAGLARVQEPFVLLFLDDLFLLRPVSNKLVLEAIEWLRETGGNHLCLDGFPKPEIRVNEIAGEIPVGAIYRTSTVATVWRKEILCSLLRTGETAWQFEMAGGVRSDEFNGFYSTTKPLLTVENTIARGRWRRSSISKIKQLGITLDLSQRPVMSYQEDVVLRARMILSQLFGVFGGAWKRKVHAALRRRGYVQQALESGRR